MGWEAFSKPGEDRHGEKKSSGERHPKRMGRTKKQKILAMNGAQVSAKDWRLTTFGEWKTYRKGEQTLRRRRGGGGNLLLTTLLERGSEVSAGGAGHEERGGL